MICLLRFDKYTANLNTHNGEQKCVDIQHNIGARQRYSCVQKSSLCHVKYTPKLLLFFRELLHYYLCLIYQDPSLYKLSLVETIKNHLKSV